MSYTRYEDSGHYIYPDYNGYVSFDNQKISDDEIDIFLYKLVEYRQEELQERVKRGQELCKKWRERLEKNIEKWNDVGF